jgi:orotidine-5'-phosphate decarboxylase
LGVTVKEKTMGPSLVDARDRLIVALDVNTNERLVDLLDTLDGRVRLFKVGLELFTSVGARALETIAQRGGRVFLDLKLHDIPNTVRKAASAVAGRGVHMTTVHCLGGPDLIRAAREGLDESTCADRPRPLLLAVTLLTSHRLEDLKAIFPGEWTIQEKVLELAAMAAGAGADGVVCSPKEVKAVKSACPDLVAVTPGVRIEEVLGDDQARTATPSSAIGDGADYLVVGRPICGATDPAAAAGRMLEQMQSAFERR